MVVAERKLHDRKETWFHIWYAITMSSLRGAKLRSFKPGFHMVVSVVSVVSLVRKKFIGKIEFILSRTTSCICHFFCIEHLYGRFP